MDHHMTSRVRGAVKAIAVAFTIIAVPAAAADRTYGLVFKQECEAANTAAFRAIEKRYTGLARKKWRVIS